MEWMKDYWYIIIPGLIAAMVIFGHRTKGVRTDGSQEDTDESHDKKSGHSCCH